MRGPAIVALIASALFATSLLLPTVDVLFLKKASSVDGWMVVYIAFAAGFEAFADIARGVAASDGQEGFYLASFAAAFNLLFLILPVLLFRRTLARRGLGVAAGLCCVGLAAGVATPARMGNLIAGVEVGFYVWLGAYGVLLCALALAWIQARAGNNQ